MTFYNGGDLARREFPPPATAPAFAEKGSNRHAFLKPFFPLLALQVFEIRMGDRLVDPKGVHFEARRDCSAPKRLSWCRQHVFITHYANRQAGSVDPALYVCAPIAQHLRKVRLSGPEGERRAGIIHERDGGIEAFSTMMRQRHGDVERVAHDVEHAAGGPKGKTRQAITRIGEDLMRLDRYCGRSLRQQLLHGEAQRSHFRRRQLGGFPADRAIPEFTRGELRGLQRIDIRRRLRRP